VDFEEKSFGLDVEGLVEPAILNLRRGKGCRKKG
jgi:hypothetical protein